MDWTLRHTSVVDIGCSLKPPAHAGSSLEDFSTLKMETMHYSKTSIHTISTQRHIQEDGILHSHRCENLKSYTAWNCLQSGWLWCRRRGSRQANITCTCLVPNHVAVLLHCWNISHSSTCRPLLIDNSNPSRLRDCHLYHFYSTVFLEFCFSNL
jgi:hypothetical protein